MKYFKLFENIKNDEIFNKIRKEYFTSPVIDFSMTQQDGYRVSSNKVMFGTFLTTEADVDYLLHEMGHFVLFKDYNRLLKNEYGLDYPKIEIGGELYSQSTNWTDVKNETRAVIYQYILAQKYGLFPDIEEWLKSLRLLDGFAYVPIDGATEKDYSWYEKDGSEVKYSEKEKRQLITIRKFFEEEIKNERYSIKNFNFEWFNRIKFLEENLGEPKINIYGYWDLANALDITNFLKFLKNNNIYFKYNPYPNKLEIEVETLDTYTQKILINELKKINSLKNDDDMFDKENDVILITPIKYN